MITGYSGSNATRELGWRTLSYHPDAPDFRPWRHISDARERAAETQKRLEDALATDLGPIASSDLSLVVFGSLAREEWTSGSDIDWLVLVDGQADPQHEKASGRVRSAIAKLGLRQPNPAGAFGNMDFSHGLIHQIGGEEDTNSNITKRVSLLLEAKAIGRSDAFNRTIRGIIDRYVDDVLVTTHLPANRPRVPRFLLNDIVRFWRTMAVDFANKKRARSAKGWALRSLKLRMPRKLLFASGLIMCFSCHEELDTKWNAGEQSAQDMRALMNEHLFAYSSRSALDIVASAAFSTGDRTLIDTLLGSYDEYILLINNAEHRQHLETLALEQATNDVVWESVNDICSRFEDALVKLFFDFDPYRDLTRTYGVF